MSTVSVYSTATEAETTSTRYGGHAYVVETTTAHTTGLCSAKSNATAINATTSAPTSTLTLDARCAPSALTSAYSSYGLSTKDDCPAGGAAYKGTTDDASQCCQMCANANSCAAMAWDSRTGACTLEFSVDSTSGTMDCGYGMNAFYDYGPDSPMSPGSGLYVQAICGNIVFAAAGPDDGS
jgi:hypothetical protein